MLLEEIIKELRNLANDHQEINGFYTGLTSEHNDSNIQYPALRLSFPYTALASQDDDVLSVTFNLSLLVNEVTVDTGALSYEVNTNFNSQNDTLNEIDQDLVDENLMREKAIRILSTYIQGLRNRETEYSYFIVQDGWLIESLERAYNDTVTGAKVQITISVANDYKCLSIANPDKSVWKDELTGDIYNPYTFQQDCPPCPSLPSTCNEILTFIAPNMQGCVIPSVDYSDVGNQNALTPTQVDDLKDVVVPDLVYTIGNDTDFNRFDGTQVSDLTTRLCPIDPQYSMSFDGVNESITLYDKPEYNFTNLQPFSGTSWIKSNNYGGNYQAMIAKRSPSFVGYSFFFYLGDLYLLLQSSGTQYAWVRTNGVSFTNNTWYQVGFTYNGNGSATGIKLYRDGVQLSTFTIQSNLGGTLSSTTPLLIGSDGSLPMYMNGKLGYTRLYNVELSPSEMLSEYNGGTMAEISPNSTNQVMGWKSGQNGLVALSDWFFPNEIDKTQQAPYSNNMEAIDRTTDVP